MKKSWQSRENEAARNDTSDTNAVADIDASAVDRVSAAAMKVSPSFKPLQDMSTLAESESQFQTRSEIVDKGNTHPGATSQVQGYYPPMQPQHYALHPYPPHSHAHAHSNPLPYASHSHPQSDAQSYYGHYHPPTHSTPPISSYSSWNLSHPSYHSSVPPPLPPGQARSAPPYSGMHPLPYPHYFPPPVSLPPAPGYPPGHIHALGHAHGHTHGHSFANTPSHGRAHSMKSESEQGQEDDDGKEHALKSPGKQDNLVSHDEQFHDEQRHELSHNLQSHPATGKDLHALSPSSHPCPTLTLPSCNTIIHANQVGLASSTTLPLSSIQKSTSSSSTPPISTSHNQNIHRPTASDDAIACSNSNMSSSSRRPQSRSMQILLTNSTSSSLTDFDTQGYDQFQLSDEYNILNNSSSSISSSTSNNIKQKRPKKPLTVMEKRAKKNAQSRMRAAKLKEQIESIVQKSPSKRTKEEQKTLDLYEERRQRKNGRSRERAIEKKLEMERILSKPLSQRTMEERKFLEVSMMTKLRKNDGDRMRRERIKREAILRGGGGVGRSRSSSASYNTSGSSNIGTSSRVTSSAAAAIGSTIASTSQGRSRGKDKLDHTVLTTGFDGVSGNAHAMAPNTNSLPNISSCSPTFSRSTNTMNAIMGDDCPVKSSDDNPSMAAANLLQHDTMLSLTPVHNNNNDCVHDNDHQGLDMDIGSINTPVQTSSAMASVSMDEGMLLYSPEGDLSRATSPEAFSHLVFPSPPMGRGSFAASTSFNAYDATSTHHGGLGRKSKNQGTSAVGNAGDIDLEEASTSDALDLSGEVTAEKLCRTHHTTPMSARMREEQDAIFHRHYHPHNIDNANTQRSSNTQTLGRGDGAQNVDGISGHLPMMPSTPSRSLTQTSRSLPPLTSPIRTSQLNLPRRSLLPPSLRTQTLSSSSSFDTHRDRQFARTERKCEARDGEENSEDREHSSEPITVSFSVDTV